MLRKITESIALALALPLLMIAVAGGNFGMNNDLSRDFRIDYFPPAGPGGPAIQPDETSAAETFIRFASASRAA